MVLIANPVLGGLAKTSLDRCLLLFSLVKMKDAMSKRAAPLMFF